MKNKISYIVILLFVIICCKEENRINASKIIKTSQNNINTSKKDTLIKLVEKDSTELERIKDSLFNYALFYVIIADQNKTYQLLHKKMIGLKVKLNLSIDSLGRSFNKQKNLIAYPENDEDEMYAGQYYPRRESSKYLSIEYLWVYDNSKRDYESKNMVLVAGIFQNEKSADSALVVLKKFEKNAIANSLAQQKVLTNFGKEELVRSATNKPLLIYKNYKENDLDEVNCNQYLLEEFFDMLPGRENKNKEYLSALQKVNDEKNND